MPKKLQPGSQLRTPLAHWGKDRWRVALAAKPALTMRTCPSSGVLARSSTMPARSNSHAVRPEAHYHRRGSPKMLLQ